MPQHLPQQDAPLIHFNAVTLVTELKPDTLSHDASAGELRIWCRKYEAYYHASNMQLARNQVQQAYLWNCLDSELYLRLTSAIADTTPVLGAGASCLNRSGRGRYSGDDIGRRFREKLSELPPKALWLDCQFLSLIWVPPPQVRLHSSQSPHIASTAK